MSGRARQARGSRRGLSQNIVRGLAVRPHELIVEIGAGGGRLTEPFARHARRVIAVELDPRLAAQLHSRFEVVEGDALSLPARAGRLRVRRAVRGVVRPQR